MLEWLSFNPVFGGTSYWAWIATLYLIILTWQDHKRNMRVDDRLNYLMMGVTFSLLSHISRPLWYVLVLFLIVVMLNKVIIKFGLGNGDAKTLAWIFYGLGIFGTFAFLWYGLIFIVLTLVYHVVKKYVYKIDLSTPTPYYWVLLLCFVFTGLLMGLY